MFQPSLTERLHGALEKSQGAVHSSPVVGELRAHAVVDGFAQVFGKDAQHVWNNHMLTRLKALGTVDIGALRMVSVVERIHTLINRDARFLQWLELRAAIPINDYQLKILESDPLDDEADIVSADRTTLFPEKNSRFTTRYNTLTVVGNTVSQSIMARNIAQQQMGINPLDTLVDHQINRIRKTQNRTLMVNTETVDEGPTETPQLGGFFTRSTVSPQNAATANFNNTLLQTGINLINNALGDGRSLALWIGGTGAGQLPVIRDLMINRYNGENSATHRELMDDLRREQLSKANIPTQVVYEGYPGGAIPVIYDKLMPANTALLFDDTLPQMARFMLDGNVGPFIMARPHPESALYEVVAVFDMYSLYDPLPASRVRYTNLAS
jgi:hypothetical protein